MNEINEGKIYDVTTQDDEWRRKIVEDEEQKKMDHGDVIDSFGELRFHNIRIESPFAVSGGKVFLDDFRVKGLISVEFNFAVGEPPIVTIKLYPNTIDGLIVSPEKLRLLVCKDDDA